MKLPQINNSNIAMFFLGLVLLGVVFHVVPDEKGQLLVNLLFIFSTIVAPNIRKPPDGNSPSD